MKNPPSIMVILPNSMGDAILASGLIKAAVDENPLAEFTLVMGPTTPDLFRATPRLRRIIVMRKKPWKGHWFSFWCETVGTQWSLIIDLRNSAFSRLLFAKQRGYVRQQTGQHKVIQNATALRLNPPPSPAIYCDDRAYQRAKALLANNGSRAIIALGPGANWAPKRWPSERFVELVTKLRSSPMLKEATVLIAAAPNEAEDLKDLFHSLPEENVISLIGEDLLTIAACFQKASVFIGNDSGLMHLAAAQDIPTLGLFGPGYVELYHPWGALCATVKTPESNEELRALLQTRDSPNLMGSLTVDAVYAGTLHLLERAFMIKSAQKTA